MASKGIEVVTSTLSHEELDQIEIQVNGDSLDDLSLNIKGPEEIIAKIEDNCD